MWQDVIEGSGCAIFIGAAIAGFLNMIKFRQHKSFSMGLLYICAIGCLLLRATYFVIRVSMRQYEITVLDVKVSIFASITWTAMVASQLLIYVLLRVKLQQYWVEREEPKSVVDMMLPSFTRKELRANVVIGILVIGMPCAVLLQELFYNQKGQKVNQIWVFFSIQIVVATVLFLVGICASTYNILELMTKLFGEESLTEKVLLKKTLSILVFAVVLKMLGMITLIVTNHILTLDLRVYQIQYTALSLVFWVLTELVPCLYLFVVHYKNFVTMEGYEYLETCYPNDFSTVPSDIM